MKLPCSIALCWMLILSSFVYGSEPLRVYIGNFKPYNYVDDDDNKIKGLAVDLLHEIWRDVGQTPLSIKGNMPWARAMQIGTDGPNTLLFTVGRSTKREAKFQWVCSITPPVREVLVAHKDSSIDVSKFKSLKDMPFLFGAIKDDHSEEQLLAQGVDPKHVYSVASSIEISLIKMLLVGRVDIAVGAERYFVENIRKEGMSTGEFKILATLGEPGNPCYAFSNDVSIEVVERYQKALDGLIESGRRDEIMESYGIKTLDANWYVDPE